MGYDIKLIERALKADLSDMNTMHPDLAASTLREQVPKALRRIAELEAVLINAMDRLIEIHENEALPMAVRQIAADLDDAIATTLAAVPMTGEGQP